MTNREEFKQDFDRMCAQAHQTAVKHFLPDPTIVLHPAWEMPVKSVCDVAHYPDKNLQYMGVRIEFGIVRNTPVNVIER